MTVKNIITPSIATELYSWKNANKEEYLSCLPITSYPTLIAAGGIYLGDISNDNEVAYQPARVMSLLGFDYEGSSVIEIDGNSMAPGYPRGSQYVVTAVSPIEEKIRLLSGVCLFFMPYKAPIFRRIISNKGGVPTLKVDSIGEEFEMPLASLCCPTSEYEIESGPTFTRVYKLGQAIHMPIE